MKNQTIVIKPACGLPTGKAGTDRVLKSLIGVPYYQIIMKPNSVALFKIGITTPSIVSDLNVANPEISVYPNPALDIIKIQSELNNLGEITIFSINGKSINQYYFNSKHAEILIDFLPAGIYFIKTKNGSSTRFIKE